MGVERVLGCLPCVLLCGAVAGVSKAKVCKRCGGVIWDPATSQVRHPHCQAAHRQEYNRAYALGWAAAERKFKPERDKEKRLKREARNPEGRERRLEQMRRDYQKRKQALK